MVGVPMLTILIFLPLAVAIGVAAIDRRKTDALYGVGLAGTLAALALSAVVFFRFDPNQAALQFVQRTAWIPSAGVSYHVGVDGISLPLMMLTTVIMPLALLSAWGSIADRVKEFVLSMLVLETALLGTFLAARRPRRGADGRQRGAGGGPAENGHVWLFALLTPTVPAGYAPVRAAPLCAGHCRYPLRRYRLVGPARREAAGRHEQRQPSRSGDPRRVRPDRPGRAGQPAANGQPWHQHRRAVSDRRRPL